MLRLIITLFHNTLLIFVVYKRQKMKITDKKNIMDKFMGYRTPANIRFALSQVNLFLFLPVSLQCPRKHLPLHEL